MLKIVRWDDGDAIIHDPLRMRITVQTFRNLPPSQLIYVLSRLITRE
jgi:hypothetical protein